MVLTFGLVAAWISPVHGDLFDLAYRVKPNDRFEYSQAIVIDAGDAGRVNLRLHFAERVISVTENEIAWSSYVAGVNATAKGLLAAAVEPFRELEGLKFVRKTNREGKSETSVSGMSLPLTSSISIDLTMPKGPVPPGATWTDSLELNGEKALATFRFDGVRNGAADVSMVLTGTTLFKQTEPTRYRVELSNGKTRSITGAFETNQGGYTLKMRFGLERISPRARYEPNEKPIFGG